MSTATVEAKPLLTTRDSSPVVPFAIAKSLPAAAPKSATLEDMIVRAKALESAASRAGAVLEAATAKRGKYAQNLFTRIASSKALKPALIGLGAVATVGTIYALWPESRAYRDTWNGWLHRQTGVWYGWHVVEALAGGAAIGAALAGGGYGSLKWLGTTEKARMARDQVRLRHVQPLDTMFEAAKERPLERAALGRVARDALTSLAGGHVFTSQDVTDLLTRMASEADVGDAEALAEANRHRAFISALEGVERRGGDPDQRVIAFNTAFASLTPDERRAVAPEVLKRVFDEAVPRAKDIPFIPAEDMRAKILAAREPPAAESDD